MHLNKGTSDPSGCNKSYNNTGATDTTTNSSCLYGNTAKTDNTNSPYNSNNTSGSMDKSNKQMTSMDTSSPYRSNSASNSNDLNSSGKPKIQNVKYDSTTGKMYEELGSSSGAAVASSGLGTGTATGTGAVASSLTSDLNRVASDYLGYQNYQSYPYGNVSQVQYVGSFASGYGSTAGSHQTLNPYDR